MSGTGLDAAASRQVGLRRLLENPHPLVRAIARCALTRAESRGAHQRLDFPERDPALDGHHVIVRGGLGDGVDPAAERQIAWQTWS